VSSLRRTLLRLFFRLLYNEFAWSYDLVAWLASFGQWKAWGRSTIPHLSGERVLDLGHGPGHLLVALSEQGFSPVGLDLSPHMGRRARRRMRGADRCIPLLQGRAQALPFRATCFDTVVTTFPAEFIVDPVTMGEVARVLAPGGRLTAAASVRFEGPGVAACLLRGLYRVTGQHEPAPDAIEAWCRGRGLPATVTWEQVGRAAVMLVVAVKP
jgi:ubiquinone/menaquinone biosynthesis C-methylase UbiE